MSDAHNRAVLERSENKNLLSERRPGLCRGSDDRVSASIKMLTWKQKAKVGYDGFFFFFFELKNNCNIRGD